MAAQLLDIERRAGASVTLSFEFRDYSLILRLDVRPEIPVSDGKCNGVFIKTHTNEAIKKPESLPPV